MSKSEVLVTIFCAILASSGFWAFLSNLIQKPQIDTLLGEVHIVNSKVNDLSNSFLKSEADNARNRILRFDDELYNDMKHSQEYFIQILADIDFYEHYCETHPEYRNSRAVEAIKHVKEIYTKCRDEHLFA